MTKQRLHGVLACYAALALIALSVLKGPFLLVILLILAGLAVKSWVAFQKERLG